MKHVGIAAIVLAAATIASTDVQTWSPQGHRLVALVAMNHLKPAARGNVTWLLSGATLADVAVWADEYLAGNNQTSFWHYVNIPPDARSYDRARDCPTQPGVAAGSPGDRWRDCVIDRISYNQERLGNASLDRADRAIALKFIVHFVGDIHQPFHALGTERGGNGIPVSSFGSTTCMRENGTSYPCNLHGIWDTELIAHRRLGDRQYLAALEQQIARRGWNAANSGSPAEWAMESHALANAALLRPQSAVDETYYRLHIAAIEQRLSIGGLRLAEVLNHTLNTPNHSGTSER